MPKEISKILLEFSKELKEYREYNIEIALSIGDCKIEWQKEILKNILNQLDNISLRNTILDILAIASWRSKDFILIFSQNEMIKIIEILYSTLSYNLKSERKHFGNIIKQLELLLAIIRVRTRFPILCLDNIKTQRYIKLVDKITKYVINEKVQLKTRLKFNLDKPQNFKDTPDLLYALRVYLSGDNSISNNIKILVVNDN